MTDINKQSPLSKKEMIEVSREKENWTGGEVRSMITRIKERMQGFDVQEVRVGDVMAVNIIKHPAMVIKVTKAFVAAVTMTTNQDYVGIIQKCDSRIFPDSHFTSTIVFYDLQETYTLMNIYDNKKDIKKVKDLLKENYKKLLNI